MQVKNAIFSENMYFYQNVCNLAQKQRFPKIIMNCEPPRRNEA